MYNSKLSDPKDSLKKHTSHFKRDWVVKMYVMFMVVWSDRFITNVNLYGTFLLQWCLLLHSLPLLGYKMRRQEAHYRLTSHWFVWFTSFKKVHYMFSFTFNYYRSNKSRLKFFVPNSSIRYWSLSIFYTNILFLYLIECEHLPQI